MIVISSALALALAADDNADLPILGWENRVTVDNITADSEAEGFPATNLANPSTTSLQGWRSDSTSTQYVTLTLDPSEPVDYLGIARHNFGSTGATVSIEGMEDGESWEEIVEEHVLGDDDVVLFRFVGLFLVGIRIKIQPVDTEPRAAVLYVGTLTVFERGVQAGHTPITYARNRNVMTGRSQSGDFLGRIIVGGTRQTDVAINWLTPAWYRSTLEPFMAVSAESPFFWGWKPETYPDEVGFAWLTSDPRPIPAHLAGYINVQFQMEGIL